MEKKIKLDPNKVTFDGRGLSIVVKDQTAFEKKIKKLREQIWKDLWGKYGKK